MAFSPESLSMWVSQRLNLPPMKFTYGDVLDEYVEVFMFVPFSLALKFFSLEISSMYNVKSEIFLLCCESLDQYLYPVFFISLNDR